METKLCTKKTLAKAILAKANNLMFYIYNSQDAAFLLDTKFCSIHSYTSLYTIFQAYGMHGFGRYSNNDENQNKTLPK